MHTRTRPRVLSRRHSARLNSRFQDYPMLPSEEKPLPAVGAYWIEEADYPALLKLFDDGDTMPRVWKGGLKMAEEMEKGLKAYGHPVMRVPSIRSPSRSGARRTARRWTVKGEKLSSPPPSWKDTAIR